MSERQKKRGETDAMYKWRLEDLYASNDDWQGEYGAISDSLSSFGRFRDRLSDPGVLHECLKERDALSERAERLFVYATMRLHEDSGDSFYQGMADMAESLIVKLSAALSFIDPGIIAADRQAIEQRLNDDADFARYRHYIDDLLRAKEHILSPEMEELLAQAEEIGQAPDNIFSMINDADMKFGFIENDEGNLVELTQGRYMSFMESGKREVRKNAFDACYDAYIRQKNTLAATYNASVKKDAFFARAHKYGSALEGALFAGNIPRDVYVNLIQTVRGFLPDMHRYISLRKRFLGLDELHMYDLYTPIIAEANTKTTFNESKAAVLRALAPMGGEYTAKVNEAFESGWLDVYENEGKRSGAYSWGAYGAHPFVLLNFDNKINDMFTLAHEMGHAMHSHYTWTTQPYVYGDYTIFVAEVASTVNECLLMDHLLKTTEDETMRAYLLNYFLEQFRGTVFRQTMFAEFEMITHEMVEKGEPLTVESLCAIYRRLNEEYQGPEMVVDEKIDMEWARIPHFYSAFYVYQYATGYSAAVALSRKILEEGGGAVNNYIEFLKGGSSSYSIDLLKKAGVDMSAPAPVGEALKVFRGLLDQMEVLAPEKK